MSGPGKGRYTTFVDKASPRNSLLWKLFNNKAPNDAGIFYGGKEPSDNATAAAAAVATATANVSKGVGGLIPENGVQTGDTDMFPSGVNLRFGGSPDLADVKWNRAGDPANSYVPDISSPGPGRTQGIDKDVNPGVSTSDIKPNYVAAAPGTGTTSPSSTSTNVGLGPLGNYLTMGSSTVKTNT